MITIEGVSKSFGTDYIFQDVNLTINETDKVGIVGKNGVGKSTLLRCVIDDSFLDSGLVNLNGHSIGYLDQNTFVDRTRTVFEEFYELFPELQSIYNRLQKYRNSEESLSEEELSEYIRLEERYQVLEGYSLKSKFLRFMTGFSFTEKDLHRKIESFSGGEKTKLVLIKLLLLDPDFLVLDEPTNHLDIYAIEWLENYLKKFKKGLILVSHDQEFLDNVCNKIIEVTPNAVREYNSTFGNYLYQRELNYENDLNAYNRQQKLIKKYEEFIIRFRGKPSKVSQVNDRKNKLERMDVLEMPIKYNDRIHLEFEGYNPKKDNYLELKNAVIGYGSRDLISNLNLKISAGEKVFLIGSNGVGKTTLFKSILADEVKAGKIKLHPSLKVGYFEQEQQQLPRGKSLYDILDETGKFDAQTSIRKYLARFLFIREDINKTVENLSGGEKVRLTLALMSLERYDLILLDEPTNHLDFETKQILEDALDKFPGSLLVISHDRHLINKLSTSIIEFKGGGAEIFQGNWTDYQKLNLSSEGKSMRYLMNGMSANSELEKTNEERAAEQIPEEKQKPKTFKINQQKLELIEEEISVLEEKQKVLNEKLSDPKFMKNYEKREQLLADIGIVSTSLAELYENFEKTIGE